MYSFIAVLLLLLNSTTAIERNYSFRIIPTSLPLSQTIPSLSQLYKTWPNDKQRQELPKEIPALAVVAHNDTSHNTLMGPTIHVETGDRLQLELINDVPHTGLSLHLHGLSYDGAFQYAGSVGVGQCPLSEGNSFTYDVVVNDRPGTYWYYTSSGNFDSYDAVRGALIVHPPGSTDLVNVLNTPSSTLPLGYTTLAYSSERVLFFQDGSLDSSSARYSQHIGGVVAPPSKADGVIVATTPWHFGTTNGKLREVIKVNTNQKYKFRVINGGQHASLRFSVDGFPLTVVAVDSQPIEPFSVDQLVIHVGERFDVEIFIFGDLNDGEQFWIRADTLEPTSQGFMNGIRAILQVSSSVESTLLDEEDVLDPPQNIASTMTNGKEVATLNCHGSPGCIPITNLSPLIIQADDDKGGSKDDAAGSEVHTVDTHHLPAPQYAHLVSIDGSDLVQNELPPGAMISRTFRPEKSIHPHSMALRVDRNSSVIIIWRTTLLMDVPMHIHGHSVEVLGYQTPILNEDCTLQSCKLSEAYESKDRLLALDSIPPNQSIQKDTFVIPAGGAVATRLQTGNRSGLWMVSGQRDVHGEDGLSFVLIIGDYRIPKFDDNWPIDFPSCNTTLVNSLSSKPSCECYTDKDAPLQLQMPGKKLCSRSHLCLHDTSQASNLDSYVYDAGLNIQSGRQPRAIPDFLPTLVFVLVVLASIILVIVLPPMRRSQSTITEKEQLRDHNKVGEMLRRLSSFGIGSGVQRLKSNIDVNIESSSEETRDSILGFSVVAPSYIGTVTEQIEEEEDENESDSSNSDLGPKTLEEADLPPPPPSNKTKENRTNVSSKQTSVSLPLPPPRRLNTQISTSDFFSFRTRRRSTLSTTFERIFSQKDDDKVNSDLKENFQFVLDGFSVKGKVDISPVDESIVHQGCTWRKQLRYLFPIQLQLYSYTCINLLRIVEVVGLASLAGLIFQSVGSDNSQSIISDLSSLMIVLTVMWSFSRLFSSIVSAAEWWKSTNVVLNYRRFGLLPVFLARALVVLFCESAFPTIAVFICFPIAGLAGDLRSLANCAFLLACNNMYYISLGCALGMYASSVSHGVIAATIFTQIAIILSGVFVQLPDSLRWAQKLSPFYWTVQGLLKSVFQWSDTFECSTSSSSEISGSNQCFLEFAPLIEQYSRKDLNLAVYNDPSSDSIITEGLILTSFTLGLWLLIFLRCMFAYYKLQLYDILAIIGDFVDAILSGE